jgi:hypothetical protein
MLTISAYSRVTLLVAASMQASYAQTQSNCDPISLEQRYSVAARKKPLRVIAAAERESADGGAVTIRQAGQSLLLIRVDYGESGRRERRLLTHREDLMVEDVLISYFHVNEVPNAKAVQSEARSRALVCSADAGRAPLLVGGRDKAKVVSEVLSGFISEPSLGSYVDLGRLSHLRDRVR